MITKYLLKKYFVLFFTLKIWNFLIMLEWSNVHTLFQKVYFTFYLAPASFALLAKRQLYRAFSALP